MKSLDKNSTTLNLHFRVIMELLVLVERMDQRALRVKQDLWEIQELLE